MQKFSTWLAESTKEDFFNLAYLQRDSPEHAMLPTYNRAQKLAQIAAVSLGLRQFNKTINALKMLQTHLGSQEEWIDFAHQGLTR